MQGPAQLPSQPLGSVKTRLGLSSCSGLPHLDYAVSHPPASSRSLLFLHQVVLFRTAIWRTLRHSLFRTFQWLLQHLEQHSSSLSDLLGLKWPYLVFFPTSSATIHSPRLTTLRVLCPLCVPQTCPLHSQPWAFTNGLIPLSGRFSLSPLKLLLHIVSLPSFSVSVLLGERLFWILPFQ